MLHCRGRVSENDCLKDKRPISDHPAERMTPPTTELTRYALAVIRPASRCIQFGRVSRSVTAASTRTTLSTSSLRTSARPSRSEAGREGDSHSPCDRGG